MHSGECVYIVQWLNIFVCVCGEKGNSVCWYIYVCICVCGMVCFIKESMFKSEGDYIIYHSYGTCLRMKCECVCVCVSDHYTRTPGEVHDWPRQSRAH